MTCVCAVTLYHISASVIAQLRVETVKKKQSFKLKKNFRVKNIILQILHYSGNIFNTGDETIDSFRNHNRCLSSV